GQDRFLDDALAHAGRVGGTQVTHQVGVALAADLAMQPRDARAADAERGLAGSPDDHGLVADVGTQAESFAVDHDHARWRRRNLRWAAAGDGRLVVDVHGGGGRSRWALGGLPRTAGHDSRVAARPRRAGAAAWTSAVPGGHGDGVAPPVARCPATASRTAGSGNPPSMSARRALPTISASCRSASPGKRAANWSRYVFADAW